MNKILGQPGTRTTRTVTPRRLLLRDGIPFMGYKQIDGALSRDPGNTGDVHFLRAGSVLGLVTASDKIASSIVGVTGVLHDTSAVTTVMTLPAAVVTEIQRRFGASGTFNITGPPAAAGVVATEQVTYSAIASATTLTITATTADFAAGSLIRPEDGSESPLYLVEAETGIQVADEDGTNQNVQSTGLVLGGYVDTTQIVDYSSMDASVKTWLKSQLNTNGQFIFDDNF